MDRFKIQGGRRLEGTVRISGAKNAALPAMAAALLTNEPVTLQNIPHVRDIITMAKLLAHMRCRVESPDLPPSEFTIQAETVSLQEARQLLRHSGGNVRQALESQRNKQPRATRKGK